jgi:hypothetical protein
LEGAKCAPQAGARTGRLSQLAATVLCLAVIVPAITPVSALPRGTAAAAVALAAAFDFFDRVGRADDDEVGGAPAIDPDALAGSGPSLRTSQPLSSSPFPFLV